LLLSKLGYPPSSPMNLYYNNKAARKIFNNLLQHNRTKHVELNCHFIKEKLDTKIVALPFAKLILGGDC
jgi:hypothetical protein